LNRHKLGKHICGWEDNIKINLNDGMGRNRLDSSGSEYKLGAGCCEHGNEPSSSIICREFLNQLSNYGEDGVNSTL
jgi:hypothetical protein